MQNTTNRSHADAASKKPGRKTPSRAGWPGGNIAASEFRSPERAQARYREAVSRGWADDTEAGQLAFTTLWVHCGRSKARSPGGLFSKLLRAGDWQGTAEQEDQARGWLRYMRRTGSPSELVTTAAAAFALPEELAAAGRYANDEP